MSLDHLDAAASGETDHRLPGDAVEEAVGQRGVQSAVDHPEQTGARALGEVTAVVEHQGIVVALGLGLVLGERARSVRPWAFLCRLWR
jgi:hypothetical protein